MQAVAQANHILNGCSIAHLNRIFNAQGNMVNYIEIGCHKVLLESYEIFEHNLFLKL